MKPNLYPNLLIYSALLLIVYSCKPEQPGIWKNEKISTDTRESFHELNKQLLTYLKSGDESKLETMMSKEMLETNERHREAELIGNQLKVHKFTLMDEYYIINKPKSKDTIKNKDYSLIYNVDAKQMYLAFFIPEDTEDKKMITAVYCKYNYGWKLSSFEVEPYAYKNKTSPELFKLAKDQYKNKYLVDAVYNAGLSIQSGKPNSLWNYNIDEEIRPFYNQILKEVNLRYRFPYTLSEIPSQPKIIFISNQTISSGTYPVVYYLSTVNIKNTVALKKENLEIKKAIGKVIPGIDKDKKHIIYEAYNKFPSSIKSVQHYEIIDNL